MKNLLKIVYGYKIYVSQMTWQRVYVIWILLVLSSCWLFVDAQEQITHPDEGWYLFAFVLHQIVDWIWDSLEHFSLDSELF